MSLFRDSGTTGFKFRAGRTTLILSAASVSRASGTQWVLSKADSTAHPGHFPSLNLGSSRWDSHEGGRTRMKDRGRKRASRVGSLPLPLPLSSYPPCSMAFWSSSCPFQEQLCKVSRLLKIEECWKEKRTINHGALPVCRYHVWSSPYILYSSK